MSVVALQDQAGQKAGFGGDFKLPLLAALAYYLGAESAFVVGTLSDRIFAPFWPPNIVLFCALMLTPYKQWWLCLLAVFPAHVAAEFGVGMHTPQMLVAFATNCAVAVINAAGVKRLVGGSPWFGSLRNAGIYIVITALFSPLLVSLGGAFVPVMSTHSLEHYWTFCAQWYLSNAVAAVALGPIALILLSERPFAPLRFRGALVESALLTIALVVVCAIAFAASVPAVPSSFLPALVYSPLPLVLWAVIRFGLKGASSAIVLVTAVLLWRALNGPSLFLAGDADTSVFAIQAFILGLAVPVLLLGASIDEARHAEQVVRESEERMGFAAYSADVCLWHIDNQSNHLWMTDYGREKLGFSPHQVITGQAVMARIHPDDRDIARNAMQTVASGSVLVDSEFRIVRPDGEIRWVRCRARAHGGLRGAPAKISGSFADISEHKKTEDELAQQRREVTHMSRVSMLGELSGGIAHELTQPLSAILSNAEAARILVARDPPDLKEVAEALDDIIREDNRAGEVIHRLRGLLKKGEAKFEAVPVDDLIRATLKLMHHELVARRVAVESNLRETLPPVWGDPIQLQQVLLNLMLNAIEAMNGVPRRRLVVGARSINGQIEIDISDSGTGLADPLRERLFQPFFSTKQGGLGLGLSICSAIVKLHGGALKLDNNPSGGATASFSLPLLQEDRQAAQ